MVPRRHVPPPSLNYTPRAALQADKCPAVDALLKQLKTCTRRLQNALASHRTELQVLERLYYKGKNQHRTALFWQRVAEMRRLGERVDEMHMDDVVESLRLSFWGEPSSRTTKIMKGPWTYYPDAKPWLFVLERCSACCMLIDRARERLVGAYESFSLMMQTGAFLQLILVLAAIASRMNMLLSEARTALEVAWSATFKTLQALYPSEAKLVRKHLVGMAEGGTASVPAAPSTSQSRAMSTTLDAAFSALHDEDVGSTLSRTTHPVETMRPPAQTDLSTVVDTETFSLSSELTVNRSIADSKISQSMSTQVSIVTSTALSSSAPKRKKADEEGSKPSKKKKKKRDEIDDIFGF
ncbi:hypothetical protein C8Q76DRAFT_742283 [Earliella scabrosa]|nr:hypothetical protein C8Q76DRAFT_742283 [Earliella scabrosa]